MSVTCPLCKSEVAVLCKKKQHIYPKTLTLNLTKEEREGSKSMANVLITKTGINTKNQSDIKIKNLTCDACEDKFTDCDNFFRAFFIDKKYRTKCKLTQFNKKPFLKLLDKFKLVESDVIGGEIIAIDQMDNFKKANLSIIIRTELYYRKTRTAKPKLDDEQLDWIIDIWLNGNFDQVTMVIVSYSFDDGNIVSPMVYSQNPLFMLTALDSYVMFYAFGDKKHSLEENKLPVVSKEKRSIIYDFQTQKMDEMSKKGLIR